MLSTQPQAFCLFGSRLTQTALASAAAPCRLSPLRQAAFFEDSSGTLETCDIYFNRDFGDGTSAQQSKLRRIGPRLHASTCNRATPTAPSALAWTRWACSGVELDSPRPYQYRPAAHP